MYIREHCNPSRPVGCGIPSTARVLLTGSKGAMSHRYRASVSDIHKLQYNRYEVCKHVYFMYISAFPLSTKT